MLTSCGVHHPAAACSKITPGTYPWYISMVLKCRLEKKKEKKLEEREKIEEGEEKRKRKKAKNSFSVLATLTFPFWKNRALENDRTPAVRSQTPLFTVARPWLPGIIYWRAISCWCYTFHTYSGSISLNLRMYGRVFSTAG